MASVYRLEPAPTINGNLPKGQSCSTLRLLEGVYGAAIIRWARTLRKISQNQYEYLFKQMGMLGYRLREPVPVPAEEPELLLEMVSVYRRASGKTIRDVSSYLGMREDDFRSSYLKNLAGIRLVG